MTSHVERTFPPYYLEHRERYTQGRVTKVADRPIWVLENLGGWSVNSIVVEGDDGLLVYDTGVNHEQGELIASEIKKLSDKPIRVIVYSHHHADHCQGTDALVTTEQVASGEVKIYAWSTFSKEYADENLVVGPIMVFRAAYQYGAALPADDLPYTGLGGKFVGGHIGTFVEPTHLIDDETTIEIGGVACTLFLTGGEASTEIGMYLPEYRTAVIADEVYISMPNLYTLRGAKFRDAMRWGDASDRVLEWDVDVLLGCHMPPIEGRERIEEVLTTYRDAIQFNHDQAVRHILAGATAEELRTGLVELPDYLDIDPFTREMYGSVANNAAQQFTGYLGWFSGDSTELAPTPRRERAARTVELIGGRDRVFEAATQALDDNEPQWAAELASMLVSIDLDDVEARNLKAAGLRTLGYREQNALRRNFYLTGALELEGKVDVAALGQMAKASLVSHEAALSVILEILRFAVDPSRALDQKITIALDLSDSGERAVLELRNSVFVVHDDDAEAAINATVSLPKSVLVAFAMGALPWSGVDAAADIEGDAALAARFFQAFDLDPKPVYLHAR